MNRDRRAVVLGPKVSGEEKVKAMVKVIFGAMPTGEVPDEEKIPNQQNPLPEHLESEVDKLKDAYYRQGLANRT